MIVKVFVKQATGEIFQVVIPGNPEQYPDDSIVNGCVVKTFPFEETLATISENYFWNGVEFEHKGLKPSMFHTWNHITQEYEITSEQLNAAKAKRKEIIDVLRYERSISPISYNGSLYDADPQAQNNLNGKIQEIFAREAADTPLTSGEMFWKDANNVIHSWTNQTTYKLWLQGLVIAISSRNTMLYATAWTKKAEVEALTDINDIITYDVTAGW